MVFRLEHVSFSYPGRPVFSDLSLNMEKGFFYGIAGPNGCGKTTLLDLLAGLRKPDKGALFFENQPFHSISKKILARKIALVPQQYQINFPFTAEEIVVMGRYPHVPRFCIPSPEDMASVASVMRETDTETLSDRRITDLSGGERQRVVFARALAQDTEVLLLDEATSNLDIHHALALMRIVADRIAKKQLTAIAVFQDINMAAAFCDRLILMKNGRITIHGSKKQVLTPENLADVFQVEARVRFDPFIGSEHVVFRKKTD